MQRLTLFIIKILLAMTVPTDKYVRPTAKSVIPMRQFRMS